MKIVSTFHHPSSVLCSLKCKLASSNLEHLVVAKLNRLDVFSLQPEGLRHESTLEIWGKVLSIRALPISGSVRSNIMVMIDHPDPELIFLSYSESVAGTGELTTRKNLSLYERTPRPAEFFNDVLVDPRGKVALVSCYTGKLKIITLKAGNYDRDFDVSLPELNVLSLTFLPTLEAEYTFAILYMDHQERIQLLSRDIHVDDLELSPHPSTLLPSTHISSRFLPSPLEFIPKLIPVPSPTNFSEIGSSVDDENTLFKGGILIVGGRKVQLYELASRESQEKQRGKKRRLENRKTSGDVGEAAMAREKERERETRKRKTRAAVEWPWSEVVAWCAVDQHPMRYLLGDSFGRLSMLSLDSLTKHGLLLIPLGETSPPTTLTYLTSQVLYLGSHLGDSQLLRINPTPVSCMEFPTLPIPAGVKGVSATSLLRGNSKGKGRADLDIDMDMDMDVDIVDLEAEDKQRKDAADKGCVVEGKGSYLTVLEVFKNIAPIVDAVLVDTDGSGQKQIVTCSGGRNTGSVNVVRNGADFREMAVIGGLTNVTGVWPVRATYDDIVDTHLVVSTQHSTHFFQLDDGGNTISQIEPAAKGFVSKLPTIAVANMALKSTKLTGSTLTYMNSSFIVQVTSSGAFLLEYDMGVGEFTRISGWQLEQSDGVGLGGSGKGRPFEIVAADINPSQVVLALNGGRLYILTLEVDHFRMVFDGRVGDYIDSEISAVCCTPLGSSKYFANYVAVSYWGSNRIEVFRLEKTGFKSVSKTPPLSALIRVLFLHNFGSGNNPKEPEYHPHVLAGLGDGSVVSFAWRDRERKNGTGPNKENQKELRDQKIVSLGHAPVCLSVCEVQGRRAVFAAGSRATVLSWEKKRLHHSPIMLKDIVAASRLNTGNFSSCLILATSTGLFIGHVRDLDKIHIRSVPLGLDNPRRLVYDPSLKVFGVACTRTEPVRVGDPESLRSSFRLLDDTSFNHLSQFNCETDEEITATTTMSPVLDGKPMSLFCLGTLFYQADENEPTAGRLLIFTAFNDERQTRSSNLQLSLLTSMRVKGCVYALTIVNGMLAAAVNASVMLFCLKRSDDESSPNFSLQKVAEWNHNYFVTSLVALGNLLVLGDQISSVSLLKVMDTDLQTVARDYGPLWPVCVEALNEKSIIGANDALNLFTFTLTSSPRRAVLERDGSYHMADMVTKFQRGALTPPDVSSSIALEPKQLFFTSSGRISIVVDIVEDQLSLHLTALQRNLAYSSTGAGGTTHTQYRAPKTSRGRSDADAASFGFLDGDFLEQFLTHLSSPELVAEIMAGHSEAEQLTMPLDDMQKVLETLQGMH